MPSLTIEQITECKRVLTCQINMLLSVFEEDTKIKITEISYLKEDSYQVQHGGKTKGVIIATENPL